MAVGGLAVGGLVAGVGVASAAHLTARQQSQIAFLMRYTHFRDGERPTYTEAIKILDEYGSRVLTLAEADALFHPKVEQAFSVHSASIGEITGCLGNGSWSYDDSGMFGWNQSISFCFNSSENTVTKYTTSGYPWIGTGWNLIWHYDGAVTGDGYPKWVSGYEQCGGFRYEEYKFMEEFSSGYGPLSSQVLLHMYVLGDADGGYAGGFWD